MVISGALAGFGGGLFYLAGGGQYTLLQSIEGAGFDGISVALLANCNPIGIFSAIFRSYLRLGGNAMQSQGLLCNQRPQTSSSVIVYLVCVCPAARMLPVRQAGETSKQTGKKGGGREMSVGTWASIINPDHLLCNPALMLVALGGMYSRDSPSVINLALEAS